MGSLVFNSKIVEVKRFKKEKVYELRIMGKKERWCGLGEGNIKLFITAQNVGKNLIIPNSYNN